MRFREREREGGKLVALAADYISMPLVLVGLSGLVYAYNNLILDKLKENAKKKKRKTNGKVFKLTKN